MRIPNNLYLDFTMNNTIPVEYKYEDASSEEIQALINKNFCKNNFNNLLKKVENKEQNYYGNTDTWLYQSLEKFPIKNKNICIMGSTCPWYEAMAVSYGVKSCTVIEYSKRQSFDERVIYKQPHETINEKFDVCFSISSFEHDGLGRYGDPLNPNGDIEAMQNVKNLLNFNGVLFLAVPVGFDKLVFNLHRVYGEKRISKLLNGWVILDKFGFMINSFSNEINGIYGSPYQPLFILKPE
jgi:hypothetical protein